MINIALGIVIGLALAAIMLLPDTPEELRTKAGWWRWHDQTDRADGKRSGLVVAVDYGTGVQYLLGPLGGITPRLDGNGQIMRIEKPEASNG